MERPLELSCSILFACVQATVKCEQQQNNQNKTIGDKKKLQIKERFTQYKPKHNQNEHGFIPCIIHRFQL